MILRRTHTELAVFSHEELIVTNFVIKPNAHVIHDMLQWGLFGRVLHSLVAHPC